MTTAKKERPAGVTILALLCFIAGGSFPFETRAFGSRLSHPVASFLMNPIAAMAVFVYLAAALVQAGFLIAIGLLKMKNWARVVLTVLCLIVLPFAVLGPMGSLMHADASSLGSLVIIRDCGFDARLSFQAACEGGVWRDQILNLLSVFQVRAVRHSASAPISLTLQRSSLVFLLQLSSDFSLRTLCLCV
jgi:hypothetical protein